MDNHTNLYIPAARVISFIILFSFIAALFIPFLGAEDSDTCIGSRVVTFETDLVFDEEPENGVLTLFPGDYYYFNIRISNLYTINDTYRIELSGIHSGWTIGFADKSIQTEVDISSEDGKDTKDVLIIVKIPETAKKDEYSDLEIKTTSINSESGITPDGTTTLYENLMIVINYIEQIGRAHV